MNLTRVHVYVHTNLCSAYTNDVPGSLATIDCPSEENVKLATRPSQGRTSDALLAQEVLTERKEERKLV